MSMYIVENPDTNQGVQRQLDELQEECRNLRAELNQQHSKYQSLQANADELDFLLQNAPGAIFLAVDGCVARTNAEMLRMFGYSSFDEVIGVRSVDLIFTSEEDYAAFGKLVVPGLIANKPVNLDWVLRRKNGTQLTARLIGRPLPPDQYKRGTVWILQDVTESIRVQEELNKYREHLEELVESRMTELQASNRQLNETSERLREVHQHLVQAEKLSALGSMVAGIAHELNTPIGNSVTIASVLQHQAKLLKEAMHSGALRKTEFEKALCKICDGSNIVLRNLERVSDLITSFKQVAVDRTSNQRRKFELHRTLQELVLTMSPMYRDTEFKLEVDLAPNIHMESHPGAIAQVITTFISNASVHAFEGRQTGVMRLSSRLLDSDWAEILFVDDGVGIPLGYQSRIFDPFFTTKLGQGGSGLGLSIAYNLVTGLLGGKIELKSDPGNGAQFAVILPLHAPHWDVQDTWGSSGCG